MDTYKIIKQYSFGYDRIRNLLSEYISVDSSNIIVKYLWADIWLCSNNDNLPSLLKKYIEDCNKLSIIVNVKIYYEPYIRKRVCLCKNKHCVLYDRYMLKRTPQMNDVEINKLFKLVIDFNIEQKR